MIPIQLIGRKSNRNIDILRDLHGEKAKGWGRRKVDGGHKVNHNCSLKQESVGETKTMRHSSYQSFRHVPSTEDKDCYSVLHGRRVFEWDQHHSRFR